MAKNDSINTLLSVVEDIQKSIDKCTEDILRLQKAEADMSKGMFGLPGTAPSDKAIADGEPTKSHAPTKSVFKMLALKKAEKLSKANTYTDMQHEHDRQKRSVTIGKPENNLPGDYKTKEAPAFQGSEPQKVKKEEGMPKAPKAAGAKEAPKQAMPKAAPQTMKTPKAPKAPTAFAKAEGAEDKPVYDRHGVKKWGNPETGALHRENGPAIETATEKHWYKNGQLHREDGPAIEKVDGEKHWYKNGQLHREDGPAVEYPAANAWHWYKNGKKHRDGDQPASHYRDGTTEFYKEGKRYYPPNPELVRRFGLKKEETNPVQKMDMSSQAGAVRPRGPVGPGGAMQMAEKQKKPVGVFAKLPKKVK